MPRRYGPVHVVTTTRRYKGKVYETHLLRRSYREGGKVKNVTVGNISHLPRPIIEMVRKALRGEVFVPLDQAFEIVEDGSRLHGHVQAVMTAVERLGLPNLIASRPSRQRSLVVAMVVARILKPQSKLATTRWWRDTTLPELLGIEGADEDDLYEAMDWLVKRQSRIEKKLAVRHLAQGDGLALFDLSSSYLEGKTCGLAAYGYNRDGKKGKLQINYGLMTNRQGIPISVQVFEGNVADPKTLLPQVDKVRKRFGIKDFVVASDRGMLTHKQIEALRDMEGMEWIGALRGETIRKLVEGGPVQMGLWDERGLAEFEHPDYPGERLVMCRNPEVAAHRRNKRQALIDETSRRLEKIAERVGRRRLRGQDKIALAVGRVIDKHKVAKYFVLEIGEESFSFRVDEEKVAQDAALDGLYVVRTSVAAKRMDAEEVVRSYKQLSQVERAFRSMKTVDLMVRPIWHRLEARVRAHVFLCMLS